MASASRYLTDTELQNILLQLSDEESLGDELADEPDEIILDFRKEPSNIDVYEDVDSDLRPEADTVNRSSDEEDIEESSMPSATPLPISVLPVPAVLHGKGTRSQSTAEKFVWHATQPRSSRTPQRNIIFHPPGNKGAAKFVTSAVESWSLFFSDDVLQNIVEHTNTEISQQRTKYKSDRPQQEDLEDDDPTSIIRPSFVKDTTVIEIKALLGLYYLAGVLKINHLSLLELFDKNTGMNYFRSCMSMKRFEFLTNCLRFDDRATRTERRLIDRLAPIKELFDHIVEKSQSFYSPSDCTTIDEQLLGFRGRCPFRMYIPSKPDKYGIKLLMFCDAKSFYMLNSIIYTGKDSTPRGIPVAEYYAMELSKPIHGSNRNITYDNWFTSIPAAEKLLQKKVTTVGTLKKNKTQIPSHFLELKNREKNTAMFAFHNELTLLSYVPPKLSQGKKKNVMMLSTMHYKPDEDKTVNLPEIISFYNKTKGGVDTFDQLCHTYSVSRKTRRWSLCVFYGILNIVGINSLILLQSSKANEKQIFKNRRSFLKTLAIDLMKPHLEQRFTQRTLPTNLQESIGSIIGKKRAYERPVSSNATTGRCVVCPRLRDRKSRVRCSKCKQFVCNEHQTKICADCL